MGGPGSGRKKKSVTAKATTKVKKALSFEKAIDLFGQWLNKIKGRAEIKRKVAVLSNPDEPKTMSNLTPAEVDFVILSYFTAQNPKWGRMFEPFKEYSDEALLTTVSRRGLGREQVIRFMGAMSETKLLQKLGITAPGPKEEAT